MNFIKYSKIVNVNKKSIKNLYRYFTIIPDKWSVTEKVHGANVSFITNGVDVVFATRVRIIESGDFYKHTVANYSGILEKEKILNLFNLVKRLHPAVRQVNIYGELFGGKYKHPDVDRCTGVASIQKGVYYAPFNGFYAFDIRIDGHYTSTYLCNNLCSKAEIFYAKSLHEGDLNECLTYPNTFRSTISKQLGLPDVDHDNICEGIVIKPIRPVYFGGGDRVIFKNKNELWKETLKKPILRQPAVLDEYLQAIVDDVHTYITENRLNNVISKIGIVSFQNFKEILVDFIKDIIEDFSLDNKNYKLLNRKEQGTVNKNINREAAVVLKNYLKQNT